MVLQSLLRRFDSGRRLRQQHWWCEGLATPSTAGRSRQRWPTVGAKRPLGRRDAYAADTVGPDPSEEKLQEREPV
jgi:hypothetical protein